MINEHTGYNCFGILDKYIENINSIFIHLMNVDRIRHVTLWI